MSAPRIVAANPQDPITQTMRINIKYKYSAGYTVPGHSSLRESEDGFEGDLADALEFTAIRNKIYADLSGPNKKLEIKVNAWIKSVVSTVALVDEAPYVFNDLGTCQRFFQALSQIRDERVYNEKLKRNMPISLEHAMKNFGLNYETGQLLPASAPAPQPQASNNPVNVQPKALPVAAPVVPQPAAAQNKSSLMDFISRHRTDIILSILTAGLYLIYLGVKEIVKQIKNALSHSNGNSSTVLSSTATIDRGGFKVNPNAPTVSSSKVATHTVDQKPSSQPLVSKTQELSSSADSEEEVSRQLRC